MENFLKTKQVAQMLGVDPRSVTRMANDPSCPLVGIRLTPRGHMKFSPSDVEEFIQKQRSIACAYSNGKRARAFRKTGHSSTTKRVVGFVGLRARVQSRSQKPGHGRP